MKKALSFILAGLCSVAMAVQPVSAGIGNTKILESGGKTVSDLESEIREAETFPEELYTPESYTVLKTETEAAKLLAEKKDVKESQLETQSLKLKAAMLGLILKAEKSELEEAYSRAWEVMGGGNLQNWSSLVEETLKDENADQKTVDLQTAVLTAVAEGTEEAGETVDKSELKIMLENAKNLDLSSYSTASAEFFQAVILSAQVVYDNADATLNQVETQMVLLQAAADALIQKTDENTLYDGVYTVEGRMWHAYQDQPSMGNAALRQPMQVIVENGAATLRMEFGPLSTAGFTGYLAKLYYFPDYTGTGLPQGQKAVEVNVESRYEDVYDSFNDPETGTDPVVKGQLYPHYMTMPIGIGAAETWVQVYVPVMESIGTGGGTQIAKLQIDWDSREQISGVATDKTQLEELIAKAEKTEQGEASAEIYQAFQKALAAAKDADQNLNVDQTAVNAVVKALNAAMDALTDTPVTAEKGELKAAIEKADSYLNADDVTYTEASREVLITARETAYAVYLDEHATQTQINAAVRSIEAAIEGLKIEGAVKTELKEALNKAQSCINDAENYTAASLEALEAFYEKALEVYNNKDAEQAEVDAQVRILNHMIDSLQKVEPAGVYKDGLHDMIVAATRLTGSSVYTEESRKALKAAIEAAEKVYDKKDATQEEVNEQSNLLALAMVNLEENTGGGNNNGGNDSSLDVKNLEDGIYSVTGKMVKVDKKTASMSDEAINHTIMLTVKDGKYTIRLDFKGLNVGTQLGYLSELKYFKTGYTLDANGNPKGSLADTTIVSYQKNSDGTLVSDQYGSNYPDIITFEMIPEAKDDGYVPLQVFVPIMEAISDGTGTQPVFLKLDWSTLKKTTQDDPDFEDDNEPGSTNENGNNGLGSGGLNNGLNGGSGLNNGSSLKSGSNLSSGSNLKSGTGSLSSGNKSATSLASNTKTADEAPVGEMTALLLISSAAAAIVIRRRRLKTDR